MSPLRFVAAVLLIAAALAAVVTDDAKPKTECEKQALKAVKKDPAGGRILARGEDISDLSRLEGAYGKGRWCKVVYRKSDECSQTCALLNYFWEKKSGQVVDMAFDRTFKAPGPCEPKKQQQEQGQRQRQQWNQRQQPQVCAVAACGGAGGGGRSACPPGRTHAEQCSTCMPGLCAASQAKHKVVTGTEWARTWSPPPPRNPPPPRGGGRSLGPESIGNTRR